MTLKFYSLPDEGRGGVALLLHFMALLLFLSRALLILAGLPGFVLLVPLGTLALLAFMHPTCQGNELSSGLSLTRLFLLAPGLSVETLI